MWFLFSCKSSRHYLCCQCLLNLACTNHYYSVISDIITYCVSRLYHTYLSLHIVAIAILHIALFPTPVHLVKDIRHIAYSKYSVKSLLCSFSGWLVQQPTQDIWQPDKRLNQNTFKKCTTLPNTVTASLSFPAFAQATVTALELLLKNKGWMGSQT